MTLVPLLSLVQLTDVLLVSVVPVTVVLLVALVQLRVVLLVALVLLRVVLLRSPATPARGTAARRSACDFKAPRSHIRRRGLPGAPPPRRWARLRSTKPCQETSYTKTAKDKGNHIQ